MTEKEPTPQKLCFVVGPIGSDDSTDRIRADWLLEMVIEPVMEDFQQFEIKRADKISTPGMIDAQIINALLNADLVIADLSSLNPNAFYEIGIRHMAQKPIIHMQAIEEKIPFDVSLFRSIKYSIQRPRDLRDARAALKSQIEAVLASSYRVDNPVTRTRGVLELEKDATSGEKVLFEQMRAMERRLMELENVSPPSRGGRSPNQGLQLIKFTFPREITDEQVSAIGQVLTARYGFASLLAGGLRYRAFGVPAMLGTSISEDYRRLVEMLPASLTEAQIEFS